MKPYKEYLQAENVPDYRTRPTPEYVWFAYKNGEVVYRSLLSWEDAEKRGNTKVVEKVCVNKADIDAWDEVQEQAVCRAETKWYEDMREEYSFLNSTVFNLCYAEAYGRGHSSGYDEVANYMIDIVCFAEKILAASK